MSIIGVRSHHITPNKRMEKLRNIVDKVIDIGCGTGRNLTLFETAVGIELDDKIILKSRHRGMMILADGQCLPVRSNTFDLALFCYSLEFMPDMDAATSEAHRVAKNIYHERAPSAQTLHLEEI